MIPTSPIQATRIAKRAQDAVRRIGEKPTSVVFKRANGTTLPAQTVRLEWDNRSSLQTSTAGAGPRMNLIVYGIRGHSSLPDTDIKEGYRFNYGADAYRIEDIILQSGEIQGIAVATG
jgi:hypothetical protein